MSEEIIKVLDNLGQKLGMSIDWTNQNVIPYIQELVTRFIAYRNATAVIQILIWIGVIVLSIFCVKWLIKWRKSEKYKDYDYNHEMIMGFGVFFSIFFIILGVGFIIGNIVGIAQNILLPELTVVECLHYLSM